MGEIGHAAYFFKKAIELKGDSAAGHLGLMLSRKALNLPQEIKNLR